MNESILKIRILGVFLLFSSLVFPQGTILKQYLPHYDALSGPKIKSIAVDRNNVLWFITNSWENRHAAVFDRISSFDGANWRQYRIDSLFIITPKINSIFVDKHNIKWICTLLGVVRYDGNSFIKLTQSNSSLPEGNYLCAAADNSNNIYFSLPNKIIRYSHNAINTIKIPNLIAEDILTDDDGVLWIAAGNLGLIRYDGNSLKMIPCNLPSGETIPVRSLTIDNYRNIWIAGNGPVAKYNMTDWQFYFTDLRLFSFQALPIRCDSKNAIYIQQSNGLLVFDGAEFKPVTPGEDKTLPSVSTFSIDKYDNVWMGTSESGVIRIKENEWTQFYSSYGLPTHSISDIAIDSKDVKWLATNIGLVRFDGYEWKTYNIYNSPLRYPSVQKILIKNDTLWICDNGIIKFDGTNWTRITADSTGPHNFPILSLGFEGDTLWVASPSGLYKYHNKTWTLYTTSNASMITNSLWQVSIDKYGNKWIIPYANLPIMRYNHPRWEWFYRDENGWPHERVNYVYSDSSGDKWFGYWGGVVRYNEGIKQIIKYSDIPGNTGIVEALGRDKSGKLIFKLRGRYGFGSFDNSNWKYYPIGIMGVHGLEGGVIAFDKNNNWWFCNNGLNVYNESGVLKNSIENTESKTLQLLQNHPNPFNPITKINYKIQKGGPVRLIVFDPLGRNVSTLVDCYKETGSYSEHFNGSNLPSGIYFYTLSAGGFSITKKMMLLK